MKNILYPLFLLLILSACTEKMELKLDSTYTRLVVEGKVTSDFQKHYVKLTESSDVFYNQESLPVSDAHISIEDGERTFSMEETQPGYYETTEAFSGEPGKTYHLSITNVDIDKNGKMEEYEGESFLPHPYAVDSIRMHFDDNYYGTQLWLVSLFMEDPKDQDNYYSFACRVNDVLVHDTITELIVIDDRFFDGNQSKGVDVGFLDQEKPDEVLHNNDEITLETYSINKEYHDYLIEFQTVAQRQNPMFSSTPANIRSNISNGAIGFFTTYSITRTKTKLTTR